MIVSNVIFAVAWLTVKALSGELHTFQIITIRAIIGSIILFSLMKFQGVPIRGNNRKLLYLRSIIGFVSLSIIFYSITKIEMGNAAALLNTNILFVILFAPLFLKEKFQKSIMTWVLIAFVGVLMILKPDENVINSWSFFALISGFLTSITTMCVRKLHSTDHPYVIAYYFIMVSLFGALILGFRVFMWPTPFQWLLLGITGVSTTLGQILQTFAFRYGEASTLAPLRYLFVVLTYIGGIIFFHEVPDLFAFLGAALIIISGTAISYFANKRKIMPAPRGLEI